MKKIVSVLMLSWSLVAISQTIDIKSSYVLGQLKLRGLDRNFDEKIQVSEVDKITNFFIDLQNEDMNNVWPYFKSLKRLRIQTPNDGLDLSMLPNLNYLQIDTIIPSFMGMENIDSLALYKSFWDKAIYDTFHLEGFKNLIYLETFFVSCEHLDLTHNTTLKHVAIQGVIDVDVSTLSDLERLELSECKLTTIDISNNSNIKYLNLSSNQLTVVDLSQNTKLEEVYLASNSLQKLNTTNNTSLQELNVDYNVGIHLEGIPQNTELLGFSCDSCGVKKVNLLNNLKLQAVSMNNNLLETVDFKNQKSLNHLSLNKNLLEVLDVSDNDSIVYLSVSDNKLEELDLSHLDNFRYLYAGNNKLRIIQFPSNEEVRLFVCQVQNNLLTSLDLSYFYFSSFLYQIESGGNFRSDGNPFLESVCLPTSRLPDRLPYRIKDTHTQWNYKGSCDITVGVFEEEIAINRTIIRAYDLQGRDISSNQKGELIIIHYSDGTKEKIFNY